MTKQITFSLICVSLLFCTASAETSNEALQQATVQDSQLASSQGEAQKKVNTNKLDKNSTDKYAWGISSSGSTIDEAALDEYTQKVVANAKLAESNKKSGFNQLDNNANSLRAHTKKIVENHTSVALDKQQNNLTIATQSDDDHSYEMLLAEADRILNDGEHSEAIKNIDKLAKDSSNIKQSNPSPSKVAKQIDDVETDYEIDQKFKKPHDYYKGASARDYINQEVKHYDDNYKVENYQSLLESIKTPEQISKSFQEIDSNDSGKYKLNDGYSIEQITTVGLLTGQEKRLKECLILKVYGGGTWRTYCQPIKKPTQCSDYDWQQLSTMAIMYC